MFDRGQVFYCLLLEYMATAVLPRSIFPNLALVGSIIAFRRRSFRRRPPKPKQRSYGPWEIAVLGVKSDPIPDAWMTRDYWNAIGVDRHQRQTFDQTP